MGYEQSASSQKNLLGFVLVLLLHVALIYALINGLAQDFVKKIAHEALEVNIIEEVKLPPPPPPPPPKEIVETKPETPPPAYVPPVEVKVQTTETQNTISSVTSSVPTQAAVVAPEPEAPAPPSPPPPKPHVAVKTKASLNAGCARPSYPAESIDMEEEGQVILSFLIDVDGHVADSQLVKSSGFTRLDDAAKQAFAKCQFTPATVDGQPEKAWVQQPFEWKIK